MSDKPRHPKLEIETNVPIQIVLGKKFYEGSNEHGKYYGYNLTHDGQEKVFFASPYVHEQFQKFSVGQSLIVNRRQKAGEKSVSWEIGSANGQAPATGQAPTRYAPSTFNREAYREQRIERMRQAMDDAAKVIESPVETEAKFDDLRSIAISFVIEENRDRVPLNPVEKPPDTNIPAILDEIKKALTDYIPGQSDIDKESKAGFVETAFGVKQWQAVTQMSAEQLLEGLAKLRGAILEDQESMPF
jgi:hypothetical protein